jgi:uncharacterized membrane protein
VTHVAAPGFFLLMGASMVLLADSRLRAGWSEARLLRYFAVRGLLLVLLQIFVENPAWLLGTVQRTPAGTDPPGGGGPVLLHFGVLYALGASMIVSAPLLRAPSTLVAAAGAGAILATQVLTPGSDRVHELFPPLTRLLVIPGRSGIWQVFYPLVPLTFLLLTLGVNLLLLAAFTAGGSARRAWARPLVLFGQTALCFYLLHLYLYALMGFAFPAGASLPTMYAAWALGLALLYPLCRAYRSFKQKTDLDAIWRLF